jgi:hypothetical protein
MTQQQKDQLVVGIKRGLMTALIAGLSALAIHSFDAFKVYGRVVMMEATMENFRKAQELNTQFRVETAAQLDSVNRALAITNVRLCRYLVEHGASDPECSTALWADYQEWEKERSVKKHGLSQ